MKSARELKTAEDYAESLILGVASLQSLKNYHIAAFKCGLLNDEEEATANQIAWELSRLAKLYQVQLEFLVERYQLNEEEIFRRIKSEI